MIAVEVTLSEWLYNAVAAREVLTLNRDYFRLGGALERRLYEVARKHCGRQAKWIVGVGAVRMDAKDLPL
jgi:plasmid replication initiation protein